MLEERFRFIDLAVRPLGKSAEGELARGELMERLMHADPAAGDDTLEQATQRLEKAGASWRRRSLLSLAALFALIGLLVPLTRVAWDELDRLNPTYHITKTWYAWMEGNEARITAGLSREDRIFLLANSKEVYDPDVLEWRRNSSMESPGEYLEEIVAPAYEGQLPLRKPLSFYAAQKNLKPERFISLQELLERAAELEPDNGRWQLEIARSMPVHIRRSSTRGGIDFSSLDLPPLAVKHLQAAVKQARMESRLGTNTRRRLQMIGPVKTLADQVQQVHFQSFQREQIPASHSLYLVWIGRGQELVEQKDPAAWKAWVALWAKLEFPLAPLGKSQTEVSEVMQLNVVATEFAKQAKALGLGEETRRMERILPAIAGATRHLSPAEACAAPTLTRGSQERLAAMEDWSAYTPGRKAEYAVADRFSALAAGIVFTLLGLLSFLEGWRRLPAQRGLAAGLMALFGRRDFAWLASLGIVVPVLLHAVVIRLTPLGCRDLGLFGISDVPPLFLQICGSLVFAWCLLLQTARWRMAKRTGLVGLRAGGMWVGWTAAALAGLCVPVAGILRYLPPGEEYLLYASPLLGMPLLWLLWRVGLAIFQPREAALGGVLACRLLLPVFTGAALLCLLLMIPLRAEERKWVALDHLGGPDPAGSLMQEMEARGLESLREKLKEAWEGR